MSTPTSPKPPSDLAANYSTSAAVHHSPYHVLAQLASAIHDTTAALAATHQEFVTQQARAFATGVSLQAVARDVRAGVDVEQLALVEGDVDGGGLDRLRVRNGGDVDDPRGASGGAAGGARPKSERGTDSIYQANKKKGISESDPIVIE